MHIPTCLRVEHLDAPLGITVRTPRLSWQLPEGARRQVAYQLHVGGWDSGRVDSGESVLVPYEGAVLSSGERVNWTVRVWTEAGLSEWAEASWWEMGLLDVEDWTASWIEPAEPDDVRAASPRPPYLLRSSFTLDHRVIGRGRLYTTAHGIYEVFLNGYRVGDAELTPGFTSYWSTLQVQTFDVTGLLRLGENVLGLTVSDGWFRGQTSVARLTNVYGDRLALLAQLDVSHTDGTMVRVGTGPEWMSSTGAIRSADLFQGQDTDFRDEPDDWCKPGTRLDEWRPVAVRDYDLSRLRSSPMQPARRIEELRPVGVMRPRAGAQVVDFGCNINGRVRLRNLGPAGTTLTLIHGETLDRDREVTVENIIADVDGIPAFREAEFVNMRSPLQVDRVTSSGGGVFEPRHTTHGFRYLGVEGHAGVLAADDVTGVVVHTDMRRTGWFGCNDPRIDALHEAAVWSMRGNACDIPTDCPTRERAGFTGDWQIFVTTAAFLYDVAGFSEKWLRDLAAEQDADGLVFNCVPEVVSSELAHRLGFGHGCAGWADAAVIVPWEIYRAYGDRDLLSEQWESMTGWVRYATRAAREGRHPSRVAARATPAAHEEFLWDTGFHWGEWLEPGEWHPSMTAELASIDHGAVATAYLCYSAQLVANIAGILDRGEDQARYGELASNVREAWQAEFIAADGLLLPDKQATYVRALAFDLVPDNVRNQIAWRLVELIRAAGTHLGTGFLATPYLLPVLADAGYLDVAYELLFQDTEPSWLTMINRGATTIWEAWDGINDNGDALFSLNHYSKGAVVSFLHRYIAGIQILDDYPAYRRFRIAPMPGGDLTSARAAHDTPYGRIESSWQIEGDRFVLDVRVPSGTTACVCLPDGGSVDTGPGRRRYECVLVK